MSKVQEISQVPIDRTGRIGRLEFVRSIVDGFQEATQGKPATVSDFIRLVGLERELQGQESVGEVKVTWVQSFGTELAS